METLPDTETQFKAHYMGRSTELHHQPSIAVSSHLLCPL